MRQVSHKHIVLLHGVCVRDVESEFEHLSRQHAAVAGLGGTGQAFSSVLARGETGLAAAASWILECRQKWNWNGKTEVLSTNTFSLPVLSLSKCLTG